MTAEPFVRYARYYDLLYRDKDYAQEARWVDGLLQAAGVARGPLLDIGCGTGAHARALVPLGWQVTGVDRSPGMIQRAVALAPRGAPVEFLTAAAADFRLARRFPAAVSLFHVASYQTETAALARMFGNVARHLEAGGVFAFDFWHGPGVRADPPARRVRQLEDAHIRVTRTAEPRHRPESGEVDVHYDVVIEDKAGGPTERLQELHRLRYFFVPELTALLHQAGLTVERTGADLSGGKLADTSWYGLIVARRARSGHD